MVHKQIRLSWIATLGLAEWQNLRTLRFLVVRFGFVALVSAFANCYLLIAICQLPFAAFAILPIAICCLSPDCLVRDGKAVHPAGRNAIFQPKVPGPEKEHWLRFRCRSS
jgi:hypothetical protein